MEINAMLCDHAQAAEGKLFISGGGIDRSWVGPDLPHMIGVGLAVTVEVPYTATNQVHKLGLTMVDEDGQLVRPWMPDGSEAAPLVLDMPFNLGRPPGIAPGSSQTWSAALNIQLPLSKLGQYNFVLSIDGSEEKRLPLLVALMPTPGGFGMGPATPGPIG